MPAPFFYDHVNSVIGSINPSTVHSQNTFLTRYYQRYLLQRIISVFKWTLPEQWEENYFLYTLYTSGHIAIIETDKFGVIPQDCGLAGYGVMYQPTHATISNPLLDGMLMPRIGIECTVIRLMPDWGGVLDLVCDYAEALALTSESTSFSLINSKIAYVFAAKNKAGAESFKKMMDKINKGDPAVFVDKELFDEQGNPSWQLLDTKARETFIAPEALEVRRRLLNMFDNDVGIASNLAYEKAERVTTAEVDANNDETVINAAKWLESCKAGCRAANDMFGLSLSVDWRVKPNSNTMGNRGETNETVAARSV